MKLKFLFILLCVLSFQIHAQTAINSTPDNVYAVSVNVAKLEKSGFKYYSMDVPAKQCRIYNLNYSLFKTFNLVVPEGYDLFDIQQVSEHLFNTDDLVEIAYISYRYNETETGWWYYTYETSIVNENGDVILNVPGAGNTEVFDMGEYGKKLLVWIYDYSVYPYIIHTNVYNLPEQSQTTKSTSLTKDPQLIGDPFPNPTSVSFSVPLNLSNSEGHLNIHNMQGGLVKKINITGNENNINLPTEGLIPGTYLINVQTPTEISAAKKIVIN